MTGDSVPTRKAAAPRRAPTSAQVAERAGVSRATVSAVLNDVKSISIGKETQRKVWEAARELGYEPNVAARNLVSGSSRTVAVLIPRTEHLPFDAFLPQLLGAINDRCHAYGYKVLLEAADDHGKLQGAFVNLARGKRIDGLIVANMRASERPFVEQLAAEGFPVVVPGNGSEGFHSRGGSFNDVGTAAKVTQHLIDLGHQRIAHLAFASEDFESVAMRRTGWERALLAAGLVPDPALLAHADISALSGYVAMLKLLSRKQPFTALFAGNDTIAFGAMRALRESGRRVPEDVAVVGYDDIPLAAYAHPALTTLRVDPLSRGTDAADMLNALMTGGRYVRLNTEYATQLVVRESCGALGAATLRPAELPSASTVVVPVKKRR